MRSVEVKLHAFKPSVGCQFYTSAALCPVIGWRLGGTRRVLDVIAKRKASASAKNSAASNCTLSYPSSLCIMPFFVFPIVSERCIF
jgi:Na+/phosphate symporter